MRMAYGEDPFGKGCLLARRLIERDVKYVEVSLGAGTPTRTILPESVKRPLFWTRLWAP